jgi:beta-lactamase regulating signal transducer with metallopeptidase domain
MNAIAPVLVWSSIQVTLLSIVASLVYLGIRRRGPATAAPVVLFAIGLMTVIVACSVSPWPNWMELWAAYEPASHTSPETSSREGDSSAASLAGNSELQPATTSATNDSILFATADAFVSSLQRLDIPEDQNRSTWTWHAVVAWIIVAGAIVGLIRLVLGLVYVSRYRRESAIVHDAQVLEQVDVICAQLRCHRPIELRECTRLSSPATIGTVRPVLLLPPDWRQWSADELNAVLAHEVAHIRNNDYLTWLLTQVGLLPHFYHPLVHWLCRHLRLDQELIADAAAAPLAGGRQRYLESLAHLALRSADRPLIWPARTLLPTRGTFMRRLEMLPDSKELTLRPSSNARWLAIAVLVAVSIVAVGIRGPGWPSLPEAVAQIGSPGSASTSPFSLAYVPRDAAAVIAIRPATLLQRPELKPIADALAESNDIKTFGMNGTTVPQVDTCHLVVLPPFNMQHIGLIVRMISADQANTVFNSLVESEAATNYGDHKYYQGHDLFVAMVERQTVLVSPNEAILRRMLVAGEKGASKTQWSSHWQEVDDRDVGVLVVSPAWREAYEALPADRRPADVASLVHYSEVVVGSISIFDGLKLSLSAKCANSENAEAVSEAANSSLNLRRRQTSQYRQHVANRFASPVALTFVDVLDELLDNAQIKQLETTATLTAVSPSADATEVLAKVLADALVRTSETAVRINNIKQVALALINYESANNRFPPAVLHSPTGVPRSWRVEILPYLEQAALYNEYRQNEPWDSEHNRKVMAQMPEVFRHPNDDRKSTNSSYFVITGTGSMFDGKEGTRLRDVVDGMSKTLMVVEAKRDIPWTKPEDIPFADDKPLPKLGGWGNGTFAISRADGSSMVLLDSIDAELLKSLITKNGHDWIRDELPQPRPPF